MTAKLTLCLHAGADQCERVTRQLSTCAGHGAAADEHRDTRVSETSVSVQPGELQSLWKRDGEGTVKCEEMHSDSCVRAGLTS